MKLIGTIALLLTITATAFAAPKASLEPFVESVAKKTNHSKDQVRDTMVKVLAESKKFTQAELMRVARGESADFLPARAAEAIRFLQGNAVFRTAVGLEAMRLTSIETNASKAYVNLSRHERITDIKLALLKMQEQAIKENLWRDEMHIKQRMKDPAEIQKMLVETNNNLVERNAAADKLYFALTAYLKLSGVPFSIKYADRLDPVIVIRFEDSPKDFQELLLKQTEGAKITEAQINCRNLEKHTNLLSELEEVHLGRDFIELMSF